MPEDLNPDDLKTLAEVFEILLRWDEEARRRKENGADESDEFFPEPDE